ncbi:MAG: hypothetical protein ACE5OZ_23255 [Candidatus Heimdallarchaeota archaeon]
MFTDHFADAASRKTSQRKISTLSLDSFISIHKEKKLNLLQAILEYCIDDIRIHGLSDRDERQIKEELEVLFGDLEKFELNILRYMISVYEDPDQELDEPHFMFHTIAHLKEEAKTLPRHLRLFKARLVGFVLNNREKDGKTSLEYVKSFIASQLRYTIEQDKLRELLDSLIGRNQLLQELEAAGFVREAIIDYEDNEAFISAALPRLIKVTSLGYDDLKDVVGSADTIKRLEKFYDLLYEKTGRDYFNMDRGMREKLLDKYFSSLMQFGDRKHDIVLDELASFLFPTAGQKEYVGGKIDKILKFLKEAESVHEKVLTSGIVVTPALESDYLALGRLLHAIFHYGTHDIFLPFISFREFLEIIYSTQSQLAMILHKRHGLGEAIVRKQLVIAFRELLEAVRDYLGDRPAETVSYLLSILFRKPQRDMLYYLATEESQLHKEFGNPSGDVTFLDAIKTLEDQEQLWIAAEMLVSFYIGEKVRKDEELEDEADEKEALTDVAVARLTFELMERGIQRFRIALRSSATPVLLGPKAEFELVEAFKFLLEEGNNPKLINQEFEYADQKFTVADEIKDVFDGSGFEMDLSQVLIEFEGLSEAVLKTNRIQLAEKYGKDLLDLMNGALFIRKVKPVMRGSVSEIQSTLSTITSIANKHIRNESFRTREFLDDLLSYCANVSKLYFKFEAFQQVFQHLIESHNADLLAGAADVDTVIHSIRTQGRKLSPFTKAIDAIGGEVVFGKRSYLSDNQILSLLDQMRSGARRVIEISQKIQRMQRR